MVRVSLHERSMFGEIQTMRMVKFILNWMFSISRAIDEVVRIAIGSRSENPCILAPNARLRK